MSADLFTGKVPSRESEQVEPIFDVVPYTGIDDVQGIPEIESEKSSISISGFDAKTVLGLSKVANDAYIFAENSPLTHNGASDDYTFIEDFKADDIYGFVGIKTDGRIVVSFKGTTSGSNVLTDIWFNWAFHANKGRYHNGIMSGFLTIESQLNRILHDIATTQKISMQNLFKKTTFTGHSLGGGLALIAADIYQRQGLFANVCTFASPRVFDVVTGYEYDQKMKAKTLMVQQAGDPVPLLSNTTILGSADVGSRLSTPLLEGDYPHFLDGYMKALEDMCKKGESSTWIHTLFGLRETHRIFKFEQCKDSGMAGSNWIGDSYLPNPLGLLNTARKVTVPLFFRPLHKIAQNTRDGAIGSAPVLLDATRWAAPKALNAIGYTASKVAEACTWLTTEFSSSKKTSEEKVVEAVVGVAKTGAEVLVSTFNTIAEATVLSAPHAKTAASWMVRKTIDNFWSFVKDVRTCYAR